MRFALFRLLIRYHNHNVPQHVHNGFHRPVHLFRKIAGDVEVTDAAQADKTVSVSNCYPTMTVTFNSRHGSRPALNLDRLLPLAEPNTSSEQ